LAHSLSRKIPIDEVAIRRLRPKIRSEIVRKAVEVSKLHGLNAQKAIRALFVADRDSARLIVGLATELRAARLISPFVETVELTDERMDRCGFDLVVDLAAGSRVYVQVKASSKFRRVDSTNHAAVLILPPTETDAEARRRIGRLVNEWIDSAIERNVCAST
jgi:hypothetical protein